MDPTYAPVNHVTDRLSHLSGQLTAILSTEALIEQSVAQIYTSSHSSGDPSHLQHCCLPCTPALSWWPGPGDFSHLPGAQQNYEKSCGSKFTYAALFSGWVYHQANQPQASRHGGQRKENWHALSPSLCQDYATSICYLASKQLWEMESIICIIHKRKMRVRETVTLLEITPLTSSQASM